MDLNTVTRPCKPSTYQGWKLCRWHDCWQGCESRIRRFDAISWTVWLNRLSSEDLRNLLARTSDCPFSNLVITDDHDIRNHLGWLLNSGRFRICGVAAQRAASAGGGNAALPVQAAQPIGVATGRSEPASPVVQSPSQGFPANLDAAAAAFVLRQAARDGIPFCEECEKARQAELRGAPASAEPASAPEPSRPQAAPRPPSPEDDSDYEIPLTRPSRRGEESAPVQAPPREASPENAAGAAAPPADSERDAAPAPGPSADGANGGPEDDHPDQSLSSADRDRD
ncbi:MAG: hypothetical protein FIA97_03645 [Methylococcaceae bacterium]|nr:hypothetical protein [Methylococcaceae bacterium]